MVFEIMHYGLVMSFLELVMEYWDVVRVVEQAVNELYLYE